MCTVDRWWIVLPATLHGVGALILLSTLSPALMLVGASLVVSGVAQADALRRDVLPAVDIVPAALSLVATLHHTSERLPPLGRGLLIGAGAVLWSAHGVWDDDARDRVFVLVAYAVATVALLWRAFSTRRGVAVALTGVFTLAIAGMWYLDVQVACDDDGSGEPYVGWSWPDLVFESLLPVTATLAGIALTQLTSATARVRICL